MIEVKVANIAGLACVRNSICGVKVSAQNNIDREFKELMIKYHAMAICFEMKCITFNDACKKLSEETERFFNYIDWTMYGIENYAKTIISNYPEFEDIIKESIINWHPDIYEPLDILYKERIKHIIN